MGLFYFIHDTRVQGIKMNAILINIKAKTKVIRLGPKASIAVHGSALGFVTTTILVHPTVNGELTSSQASAG